jgi:hypothetical protein
MHHLSVGCSASVSLIDWANLKHHDPKYMLAVCGSCHDKIGIGQIDTKSQQDFKAKANQVQLKLKQLEESVARTPPQINEWPAAVHEYIRRNVEFAIVHTPPDHPDRKYVLAVGNGCLVEENYVLTCSEALELARGVAEDKCGNVIILHGKVQYHFQAEAVDDATGLVLCKITGKDEERWQELLKASEKFNAEIFEKYGAKDAARDWFFSPVTDQAKWSISPWLGQEVGFILASDSEDNMRGPEFSRVEFGTAVISHFKRPRDFGMKVFVTSVFSGRIRQVGSAVFTRDGTLLGIISGVEQYEYDAGRRAVVKTLLGFPKFTAPKLKFGG